MLNKTKKQLAYALIIKEQQLKEKAEHLSSSPVNGNDICAGVLQSQEQEQVDAEINFIQSLIHILFSE